MKQLYSYIYLYLHQVSLPYDFNDALDIRCLEFQPSYSDEEQQLLNINVCHNVQHSHTHKLAKTYHELLHLTKIIQVLVNAQHFKVFFSYKWLMAQVHSIQRK